MFHALRAWITLLGRQHMTRSSQRERSSVFWELRCTCCTIRVCLMFLCCTRSWWHGVHFIRHTYHHGNGGPWFATFRALICDLKSTKRTGSMFWELLFRWGTNRVCLKFSCCTRSWGHGVHFMRHIYQHGNGRPSFITLLGRQYMTRGSQREWGFIFWEP